MSWMVLSLIGGLAAILGFIGCFVPVLLGPFLGTVGGELLAGKNVSSSLRGGLGALLGFVLCVGLKVASVGLYVWWYFAAI